MKRARAVVSCVLAFHALVALHAEVFYPTPNGDISTAEGWGGTLPATDAKVAFEAGTYTASADVAFGSVTNYGNVTFDFTATPDRTITLDPGASKMIVLYNTGANGSTYQFKGGTWNAPSGGYVYFASSGGRNSSASRTILLSDGVVFTNATYVICIDRDYKSLLRMTGQSSIYCTDLFRATSGSTQNSRAEILDGSSVTAGRVFTDHQPTQGGPGTLVVAGAGSTLRATHTSRSQASAVGTYLDGNALYVTNGAILDVAGYLVEGQTWIKDSTTDRTSNKNLIYLANGATGRVSNLYMGAYVVSDAPEIDFKGHPNGVASHDNELHVKSGASLSVSQLYIGADRLSHHNRVVVDGGEILCSDTGIHVGHAGWGNELVLTNVTCYTEDNLLPSFWIGGQPCSSNNVFRITGAASHVRFSGTSADRFGFGSSNTLIVENSAFLDTVDTRWNLMQNCTGCTVRVRGNARLKVDRTLYVGNVGAGAGCGNRIIVEDGGSYTNYSGGILLALSAGIAADCPYPNGLELKDGRMDIVALTVSTNCYAEFSGTNPVLNATAVCSVRNAATLRFIVPGMGYKQAPLSIKGLSMEEGAKLEIDISSKPYLDEPVILVDGSTELAIPASVLATANVALGGKGLLYLADGDRKLMLRVWRRGTSVVFR